MSRSRSIYTRGSDLSSMIGRRYGGVIVDAVIGAPDGVRGRFLSCHCAACGAPAARRRAGELLTHPPTGCRACAAKLRRITVDLSGTDFPAFRVVRRHGDYNGVKTLWECVCRSCGGDCIVDQRNLSVYTSCGCLARDARDAGRAIAVGAAVDGTSILGIRPDRKLNQNNSTGVRGVSQLKNGNYRAYITLRRKQYSVGVYKTIEEAAKARAAAENRLYAPIIEEHSKEGG